MKVNLEDYYILSSIFLGDNLTITFQYSLDIHSRRVLELKEVIGFIDKRTTDQLVVLRIDEGGGSYPFDLSLRLQRPEVAEYQETFFFTDEKCVDFNFRACAKAIIFREWTEKDVWLR